MRIYLIAAVVLAIIGILADDHYLAGRLKASRAEAAQSRADLVAERANRKIEQADRKHNDETVVSLESQLAELRKPHTVASVFCRPAKVSSSTTESGATARTDDPSIGGSPEGPLRDIGAAVDAVRIEQQTNAARQRKLMQWEIERTH